MKVSRADGQLNKFRYKRCLGTRILPSFNKNLSALLSSKGVFSRCYGAL